MSLTRNFMFKIDPQSNGCWLWTGSVRSGRGIIRVAGIRRYASRVAAHLFFDMDLNSDAIVAHTCDNPMCVNPVHLIVTDQYWNMRDMVSKGRNRNK